ncbi:MULTISPECIES: hypothetical protein [unclassified Deinococcus]|uniref:hypothetical protein n=1 Tax=unclassified Deinococcus TaxID=2623546 RepID=UPI001E5B709F
MILPFRKGAALREVRLGRLTVDTSLPTWRGRAVRYVLIYLLMVLALVTVRAATQGVRPALKEAQAREAALTTQRDDLALQLQVLENPQRLRDWAFANGMQRFTDAAKETGKIGGVKAAAPAPAAPRRVEVSVQWK